MTLKKLASEIAFREGKKSQARIGDIREIIGIISDIIVQIPQKDLASLLSDIVNSGVRRSKKKKK